jgi:predicted RNase H-like HicB family nuclease
MTEYVVVIEQDGDSWGASVPDLPGCVAVGDSRDEVELLIAEAILLHIQSLRDDGETIPAPSATGSTKVRVA